MSACRSAAMRHARPGALAASIATRDRPMTTTSRQGGHRRAVHRASVLRGPAHRADAERGGLSHRPQARAAADAADGIEALGPKPRTTKPAPGHKIYPYLLRDTDDRAAKPSPRAADITYIPIGRGFLYLVAVIDWASRAVLSWRLSNTMDASFCVAALEALARTMLVTASAASRKFSTRTRASPVHQRGFHRCADRG